jgi:hypothetical protein
VLISSRAKLSKTYVLTTALSERLMDVIALVLGSSLVLLTVSPKPRWMEDLSRTPWRSWRLGTVVIMVLLPIQALWRRFCSGSQWPPVCGRR